MTRREQDSRYVRTRAWIVQAFNELIFKRGYAALGAHLISRRAGVGRSTFYEHFRSKEALLLHSVSPLLEILADAVTEAGDAGRIRWLFEHVLEQETVARRLLASPAGAAITGQLADLIEGRLSPRDGSPRSPLAIPVGLAARQIAESQMALLRGWLGEESRCPANAVAIALLRGSRGLIAALECESPGELSQGPDPSPPGRAG